MMTNTGAKITAERFRNGWPVALVLLGLVTISFTPSPANSEQRNFTVQVEEKVVDISSMTWRSPTASTSMPPSSDPIGTSLHSRQDKPDL